VEIFNRL